ncbi:MAG: nuclear transport factor 2 family protein [Acidobacteriota bacterium]|nr:MAG: nuclear transport factor 2 family protein [Acidobacteriota bacterium]
MRRSTRAFRQTDVEVLSGIYADEFRFRLPNGRLLDKRTALDVIRSGSVKIKDVRMIEIDLRQLGEFALVSATVELDAELDGEAFRGTYAGGGSFIRREGKWQIVDEYIGVPVERDRDSSAGSGK